MIYLKLNSNLVNTTIVKVQLTCVTYVTIISIT